MLYAHDQHSSQIKTRKIDAQSHAQHVTQLVKEVLLRVIFGIAMESIKYKFRGVLYTSQNLNKKV